MNEIVGSPKQFLGRVLSLCAVLVLSACGSKPAGPAPVARGEAIANSNACLNCHTTDGSKSIAPTWKGLAGSRVPLEDGTTVTADDAYLRESIRNPSAKTVKDYPKGLMETVIKPDSLTENEVEALVDYIKTLD